MGSETTLLRQPEATDVEASMKSADQELVHARKQTAEPPIDQDDAAPIKSAMADQGAKFNDAVQELVHTVKIKAGEYAQAAGGAIAQTAQATKERLFSGAAVAKDKAVEVKDRAAVAAQATAQATKDGTAAAWATTRDTTLDLSSRAAAAASGAAQTAKTATLDATNTVMGSATENVRGATTILKGEGPTDSSTTQQTFSPAATSGYSAHLQSETEPLLPHNGDVTNRGTSGPDADNFVLVEPVSPMPEACEDPNHGGKLLNSIPQQLPEGTGERDLVRFKETDSALQLEQQ